MLNFIRWLYPIVFSYELLCYILWKCKRIPKWKQIKTLLRIIFTLSNEQLIAWYNDTAIVFTIHISKSFASLSLHGSSNNTTRTRDERLGDDLLDETRVWYETICNFCSGIMVRFFFLSRIMVRYICIIKALNVVLNHKWKTSFNKNTEYINFTSSVYLKTSQPIIYIGQ